MKLGKVGSNWMKLDQSGIYRLKLVKIVSNRFKFDKIGSCWFKLDKT